MARFKHHTAGWRGWSEWVYPKPKEKYLFKCCDCGLVHELEFKTFIAEDTKKKGLFNVIELPSQIRSMFRARRYKE